MSNQNKIEQVLAELGLCEGSKTSVKSRKYCSLMRQIIRFSDFVSTMYTTEILLTLNPPRRSYPESKELEDF